MTLVGLPNCILWPGHVCNATGIPGSGSGSSALTASGHYVSYVFCARENMTVTHVGFRAFSASGSPTIETRIETVANTGFPSGTLWATNTNGTSGALTAGLWTLQALTASATINAGQIFCVKFAWVSGTSVAIGQVNNFSASPSNTNLPYGIINTGTPTKLTYTSAGPSVAFGSSSTTFYNVFGSLPIQSNAGGTFNNTNSAKRGLRFQPPFNCRVSGIRWYLHNAIGDYSVAMFDDAGNELNSSSTAFDGDYSGAAVGCAVTTFFDNPVTATAGTWYRVAVTPTSATNSAVYTVTLPAAMYRATWPGGMNCHYTSFASGSWTDTGAGFDDTYPMMDVLIDQVDDGTGGGSSIPLAQLKQFNRGTPY